ncbi:MAG: hypothetical protein ACI4E1_08225 [Lachnospira sp.]
MIRLISFLKNKALVPLLFLFVIFFDVISNNVIAGNYLDEFIAIMSFGLMLFLIIKNKREVDKKKIMVVMAALLSIFIGVLSNIIFRYVTDPGIIVRDIVGLYKFFATFYAVDYIFDNYNAYYKRSLVAISKVLIVIIAVFGFVSLFVNIGMGSDVRYGLRSYKFIYSFYNVLVYNIVLLIAVISCEKKKNIIYYILGSFSLILTFRTKALMVIGILLVIFILNRKDENNLIYGKISNKLKVIIPAGLVLFLLAKDKIFQYISFGKYNSIRIGALVTGFEIALDHFPFGAGFGTYGSDLSYSSNSKLYELYNDINYVDMMNANLGYASMSDTFWPAVFAQIGLIGLVIYLFCMASVFLHVKEKEGTPVCYKNACIFILLYMLTVSLSEAVFINPSGVTAPVIMALLLNIKD